jgi:hypothetical protein
MNVFIQFIYYLFKYAVSRSGYRASNDRMINERVEKDMEGSTCSLI